MKLNDSRKIIVGAAILVTLLILAVFGSVWIDEQVELKAEWEDTKKEYHQKDSTAAAILITYQETIIKEMMGIDTITIDTLDYAIELLSAASDDFSVKLARAKLDRSGLIEHELPLVPVYEHPNRTSPIMFTTPLNNVLKFEMFEVNEPHVEELITGEGTYYLLNSGHNTYYVYESNEVKVGRSLVDRTTNEIIEYSNGISKITEKLINLSLYRQALTKNIN